MSEAAPQLHHERKEEIETDIDSKIQFLSRIRGFVSNPENVKNINADELEVILEREFVAYQEQYPFTEEELNKFRQFINHISRIKREHDVLRDLQDQDEEGFKNKLNTILHDSLVEYFDREDLCPKDVMQYIKEVSFNGLEVVIVFNKESREVFDLFEGLHVGKTPITIVFEDSAGYVEVHEKNHLLYGSLEMAKRILYSRRLISNIRSTLNVWAKKVPKDEEDQKLEAEAVSAAQKIINEYPHALEGEILADMDGIFDGKWSDGYSGHFDKSMKSLENYLKSRKKIRPELAERLKDVMVKIRAETDDKLADMGNLAYMAKHFGLVEDAKSAMVLFEGDVRRVLRYIRHIVGEEEYKAAPQDPELTEILAMVRDGEVPF